VTGSVVVLAHARDLGAAAVARAVATLAGPARVVLVRPERLAAARWSHRVAPDGTARTVVEPAGGPRLCSEDVGAVLHRIRYLSLPGFESAPPADRDYAYSELHAVVGSWLLGLRDRTIGAVGPHGTVAGPPSARAWLALALDCGLPVGRSVVATRGDLAGGSTVATRGDVAGRPGAAGVSSFAPVELTPRPAVRVSVVGDSVTGAPTDAIAAGCRRLAVRTGCPLLDVLLSEDVEVVAVDPVPPLRTRWAVDATARLLLDTAHRPVPMAVPG
jgi:hypothetical protein